MAVIPIADTTSVSVLSEISSVSTSWVQSGDMLEASTNGPHNGIFENIEVTLTPTPGIRVEALFTRESTNIHLRRRTLPAHL